MGGANVCSTEWVTQYTQPLPWLALEFLLATIRSCRGFCHMQKQLVNTFIYIAFTNFTTTIGNEKCKSNSGQTWSEHQ